MRWSLLLLVLLSRDWLPIAESTEPDVPAAWAHWRGPFANGSAAPSSSPPVQWSPERNIAWTKDLVGQGTATPVIWGDRLFVVSAESTEKKSTRPSQRDTKSKTVPPDNYYRFLVCCLNRNSGEVLWQKIATEQVPHEGHHPTHTYAAGSPTTDGQRLYVSFGSRGLFCYSLQGALLWEVDLGDLLTRYGWGEAVTPVIHGDSLLINWDQEEGAFLACLDAKSGKMRWKADRPEEVTSWNTPLVTEFQGRALVIVNGTNRARAYDLENGQEVWTCGGQTVNAIPSPLRYRDTAICMSGYRGAAAFAIPLGSRGDVSGTEMLRWTWRRGTPYVPSALLSGDRLFFTGGNQDILTVLHAESGTPIGSPRRLSGLSSVYASPIAAGGHLYFVGREGTCVVLKDDESLEVVSVNRLNDRIDASPVAVEDQLYLRSWTKLYCIRE